MSVKCQAVKPLDASQEACSSEDGKRATPHKMSARLFDQLTHGLRGGILECIVTQPIMYCLNRVVANALIGFDKPGRTLELTGQRTPEPPVKRPPLTLSM